MGDDRRRIFGLVGLLAALHIALAIWFAAVTPYRAPGFLKFQRDPATGRPLNVLDVGAPDERQHVNYVQNILEGHGLPVLKAGDAENYQNHQPPLFYALAAVWTKAAGVSSLDDPSAGLRLRMLNCLIGGIGVCGVFFLALWGRRSLSVAFGAAAFAALLPMNLALSGAVSNDPLLFALCTWTLAWLARGALSGWNVKMGLIVGVLAGAAVLTKTTAIALIPVVGLAFWMSRNKDGASLAKPLLAGAAAFLILATPWWIRNQELYGDPLAMAAFNEAFARSPSPQSLSPVFESIGPGWMPPALKYWTGYNDAGLGVGWWTLRSFFGVFGYMDIFLGSRLYAALAFLLLIVFAAALWPGRSQESDSARLPRLLGRVFLALILIFFFRFNAQYFQAQARYLLPAIGPIALGVGIGLARLGKSRPLAPALAASVLLLGLDLGILTWLPSEFASRTG